MSSGELHYHLRWPVLYHDNHLLALYKPAGLLVQGDATRDVTLLDLGRRWIKERYRKPGAVYLGLVHRLDRPVAGVVVLARTSKAAARLSAQLRAGTVDKLYWAVLEGFWTVAEGTFDDRLTRSTGSSRISDADAPEGRPARLSYRLLAATGSRSLVEIHPGTGRRHQIRLQFAHRGHPLVGDVRYGAATPLPGRQIALLAKAITFQHPTRREAITVTSPTPRGWPWPGLGNAGANPPWGWRD